MDKQQRILEIYRLLKEADELDIAAPGLEAELEVLEGPPQDEQLPDGAETPTQECKRIRQLRDLHPTYGGVA